MESAASSAGVNADDSFGAFFGVHLRAHND